MIAAPSVTSACSASGRTLDGPQPNRPSAGRSSAGMVMLIRGVPLGSVRVGAGGTTTARDRRARTRAVETSADDAQAGATWVVVFVMMVSKPSTSSGLRGSGPM